MSILAKKRRRFQKGGKVLIAQAIHSTSCYCLYRISRRYYINQKKTRGERKGEIQVPAIKNSVCILRKQKNRRVKFTIESLLLEQKMREKNNRYGDSESMFGSRDMRFSFTDVLDFASTDFKISLEQKSTFSPQQKNKYLFFTQCFDP